MLGRAKNMKLRYKIGMGVATGAAVLAGGGAAFAYFTTTGSGTGQGAVGTATSWTVTAATESGTIYPGQGTETIGYTVTNPGSGYQELNTLSVAVNTVSSTGDITAGGKDVAGCLATWFVPVIAHTGTGTLASISPATDLAPNATYSAVVTLSMTDSNSVQDSCKNATPDVTVSAS